MNIGDVIKTLRTERGWTQEELGKRLGVQKSAVAKYENGAVENLKRTTMVEMARLFHVSPLVFIDPDEFSSSKETVHLKLFSVPIYSAISCGTGSWIEDTPEDYIGIPRYMAGSTELFGNQATGDSMESRIHDGDYVIFERTPVIESGQIGAFSLNNEFYCKRFRKTSNGMFILESENPNYDPILVMPDDQFRVLGKYKMRLTKS